MGIELPRFAGNKIQRAIGQAAQSLVDQGEGVCTPQMVDDVISFGFGRRMAYVGYFKRLDLIGLDFSYTAVKERGDQPWGPLVELVERGEIGMKSGKGFYYWPSDTAAEFRHWMYTELIGLMKEDIAKGRI